jgi:hypothetical protein
MFCGLMGGRVHWTRRVCMVAWLIDRVVQRDDPYPENSGGLHVAFFLRALTGAGVEDLFPHPQFSRCGLDVFVG